MSKEFVKRIYMLVDGTQINVEELGYEITEEGHAAIMTMNRENRAEGYTGGIVMAELSATVPIPAGGLPGGINLKQMKADKTEFSMVYEQDDGGLTSFRDCKIKTLSGSMRQGDKLTESITIDSLRFSFDQ